METEKNQNSNTKSNSITVIKEGGMGYRLFAGIIDGLCAVFIWLILAMFVFTPIANSAFNYNYKMSYGSHYQVVSQLFVYEQADDAGSMVPVEVKDFTEKINNDRSSYTVALYNYDTTDYSYYLKRIYYYYHSFKCGRDIELPNPVEGKAYDPIVDKFVDPEYLDEIDGKTRINYYTDDWFKDKILELGNPKTLFKFDESKEGSFIDKILLKGEPKKDDVINFVKNKAYDAVQDQYYAKYFYDNNQEIMKCQLFITMPTVTIAFGLIFILVPMLSKNGTTLGKYMNKLAVVDKNGYAVKKRQVLFRELILFVIIFVALFAYGIGFTSLAICGIVILALLIFTIFFKKHRSPHDLAAMTMVIDAAHSVWFKDAKEEEEKQKELDEKMAKYKNQKVVNKNVIQVGSTIIDEDIKHEVEESRKNKE